VGKGWRCEPLVSKATVDELMRVLGYPKFKLVVDEQHELLADYLPYCRTVAIAAKWPRTPPCRDPCDLPFDISVVAECRLGGRASGGKRASGWTHGT
jgi:predicted nucleic acid-binding protein